MRAIHSLALIALLLASSSNATATPADSAVGLGLTCTATSSRGFLWEKGEFKKAEFALTSYLVTRAKNNEVSCSDPAAICLDWRDVKDTSRQFRLLFTCYWENKGSENERLDCSLSYERIILDIKRGVYVFTRNPGPPYYGGLAELFGGHPEKGHANSIFSEYGVCNSLVRD